MKAKDVLKRLVVLCDKGKVTNAQMNGVFNGMSLVSGGKVLGVYRNGLLVGTDGKVRSLSVDKIDGVIWDAVIKKSGDAKSRQK
jgi:hypothetical protein